MQRDPEELVRRGSGPQGAPLAIVDDEPIVRESLGSWFKAEGYEVRIGSRSPEKLAAFATEAGGGTGTFAEVARWGDALVLAVKGSYSVDLGWLRRRAARHCINPDFWARTDLHSGR